eukprot:9439505-Alexandrium_andersonii.AAC.1
MSGPNLSPDAPPRTSAHGYLHAATWSLASVGSLKSCPARPSSFIGSPQPLRYRHRPLLRALLDSWSFLKYPGEALQFVAQRTPFLPLA